MVDLYKESVREVWLYTYTQPPTTKWLRTLLGLLQVVVAVPDERHMGVGHNGEVTWRAYDVTGHSARLCTLVRYADGPFEMAESLLNQT